jgi:hypothetical protein
MLTIPPLKNLLQGYRNVTATEDSAALRKTGENAGAHRELAARLEHTAQRPFSAQCRSPQRYGGFTVNGTCHRSGNNKRSHKPPFTGSPWPAKEKMLVT